MDIPNIVPNPVELNRFYSLDNEAELSTDEHDDAEQSGHCAMHDGSKHVLQGHGGAPVTAADPRQETLQPDKYTVVKTLRSETKSLC